MKNTQSFRNFLKKNKSKNELPKASSTHEEIVIAAGRAYPCHFRKQSDGGYLVTSRNFLPVHAHGDTLELARLNAQQRIEAWIDYAECRD